jgi:hypothetical protein
MAGKMVEKVEKGMVEKVMEEVMEEVREEVGSLTVAWGIQVMMAFLARCIHLKDEEFNWIQPPLH